MGDSLSLVNRLPVAEALASPAMLIGTWNVNSIRARWDRLLGVLKRHEPDVLCLQETKVEDKDFPAAGVKEAGYEAAFHGQKSYNGVAILSKKKVTHVSVGLSDGEDDSHARLVAATAGKIRVVNVYVPNGQEVGSEKFAFKLRWFERLRSYVAGEMKTHPQVLLCGDFNVAPADLDVHDPEKWEGKLHCSEPEREAYRSLLAAGLQDTLRLVDPQARLFSWWDYRALSFPKNNGLRIDHVLVSAPLAGRCVACRIDRDERKGAGASDHVPVLAKFKAGG